MIKLLNKKPLSDDDHLRNNQEIENALDKRDVKITKSGGKTFITLPTKAGKIKFEVVEA